MYVALVMGPTFPFRADGTGWHLGPLLSISYIRTALHSRNFTHSTVHFDSTISCVMAILKSHFIETWSPPWPTYICTNGEFFQCSRHKGMHSLSFQYWHVSTHDRCIVMILVFLYLSSVKNQMVPQFQLDFPSFLHFCNFL